jgi:hypothetical protein
MRACIDVQGRDFRFGLLNYRPINGMAFIAPFGMKCRRLHIEQGAKQPNRRRYPDGFAKW